LFTVHAPVGAVQYQFDQPQAGKQHRHANQKPRPVMDQPFISFVIKFIDLHFQFTLTSASPGTSNSRLPPVTFLPFNCSLLPFSDKLISGSLDVPVFTTISRAFNRASPASRKLTGRCFLGEKP